MTKKINIRPTSSVYATYKRLSYQPWTAIAEFVDNSTQSFYDHKDELMAQKYTKGLRITIDYIDDKENGDRLEILDDAYGMEWYDFQRAVILDRPPQNTNGRNEFGMGLKTAACWFGTIWSVESTRLGSKNKYYTEINIDELGKYKTEEIDVSEEVVGIKEHYTKIVIRNLNKRIIGSRTVGKVKELLSSIYREDIRTGLVKIYYNGTLLQFKEAPVYIEEVSFEGYDGILNRNVNQQMRSTLIRSNGKVNHLCIGKNCFIKYWPEYAPKQENVKAHYSFYEINDLSFGYFISNMVEDVYMATVGANLPETLTSMFYPIEDTKEVHKLTEISLEI